jgi:SAM-dependent methyltransferase
MTLGDFAPQAQAYAARPPYPSLVLDRLLARTGVIAGARVADLGAGTGIFTAQLAARGLIVDAIEPSDEMRAQAPTLAGVTWRAGTFEATGLNDGAVAWVTAAQAFHWADPPRALPELARVLRADGHLSCIWNDRKEDDPTLRAVMAAIRREAPTFDERYRNHDWAATLVGGGWFTDVVYDEVEHRVAMSRERFASLWRSHNHLAESAGAALPRVLAAIDAVTASMDEVVVPYVTRAWTVRAAGA